MIETLFGISGALLLWVFFRAVESRWPESYYGLSDLTSYRLSLHLRNYATFRLLPVLLVAFLASAVVASSGYNGLAAGLVVAFTHGLSTSGRAAVNTIRQHGVFGRRLLLAGHVGIFASVIVTGYFAGVLGGVEELHALVPDVEDVRDGLWTALLAGVFGAYFIRVSEAREPSPSELIRESTWRVNRHLWEVAESASRKYEADPDLVRAVLLVENLQRPGWIRWIERVFGRVLGVGTYGIMQVKSDGPISDAESIELAVREKLAGSATHTPRENFVDQEAIGRIIGGYNRNERFVELVWEVYWELKSQTSQ